MRLVTIAALVICLVACVDSTVVPDGGSNGDGGGGNNSGGSGGGATGGQGGGTVGAAGPMIEVPAGPFVMGCDTCDADERPQHTVTLKAYAIDTTEVTQEAYAACVKAGPCAAPKTDAGYDPTGRARYPVTSISFADAVAYCAHVGKRLPTEAEWEKAARGTDQRKYPWGNAAASCALAALSGCDGGVQPVGSFDAGISPYGAFDMAGNVWEWTQDWYDAAFYSAGLAQDPTGPATGTVRVYRGGSAGNDAALARTTNRGNTYSPDVGGSGLGFRCAK